MTQTDFPTPSIAAPSLDDVTLTRKVITSNTKQGVPIPWWAKIAAKVVLARVMPSYQVRQRLGLFRHGSMDRDPWKHVGQLNLVLGYYRKLSTGTPRAILELGPGDSVGLSLAARAHGLERAYLVDVGDFATRDMTVYRRLADALRSKGFKLPERLDLSDRDAMLKSVDATYLTSGTSALGTIPDASVDVVFSTAVLEHVSRYEFKRLMEELYRVMTPGAVAHHWVDLMDHLGGALNNLRFSERVWESGLMANSGFYTNRLRFTEILDIVKGAGFKFAVTQVTTWPTLPTPRQALASPFDALPEEELKIATFGLLMQKPASAAV
jgi:SAM-dependent methyltransferase